MFVKCNTNPWNKCIDDCGIRAIAKATGKDYFDVMDGLIAVADSHDDWDIDELRTINEYMLSIGWEAAEPTNRVTVKQFAEQVTDPRVVIVKGHGTCTMNGNTYDTWNCNRYRVKWVYRKRLE
jgi:hypothetical protein